MNKTILLYKSLLVAVSFLLVNIAYSQKHAFKVIGFYRTNVENDHVDFARDAIRFFDSLAIKKHFVFDTTTNWANTNDTFLANYDVVMWINEFPNKEDEKRAFERYMDKGGAWIGFHVSGYNDKDSHWPWFVSFLGGAVFYNNNWPPLAAQLIVDDNTHPVTKGMPKKYLSPINEWYSWKPNPRDNKYVKVLVTLDPVNYPLGKKNLITSGDVPVVWTNTKYRMLYMNMGHGDHVLTDPVYQNKMIANAIMWLGRK